MTYGGVKALTEATPNNLPAGSHVTAAPRCSGCPSGKHRIRCDSNTARGFRLALLWVALRATHCIHLTASQRLVSVSPQAARFHPNSIPHRPPELNNNKASSVKTKLAVLHQQPRRPPRRRPPKTAVHSTTLKESLVRVVSPSSAHQSINFWTTEGTDTVCRKHLKAVLPTPTLHLTNFRVG